MTAPEPDLAAIKVRLAAARRWPGMAREHSRCDVTYGPWHAEHVEGCALAAALASDAGAEMLERLRKAESERDAALGVIRNWPDPDGLLAQRDKLRKLCGEAAELLEIDEVGSDGWVLAHQLKEASR